MANELNVANIAQAMMQITAREVCPKLWEQREFLIAAQQTARGIVANWSEEKQAKFLLTYDEAIRRIDVDIDEALFQSLTTNQAKQ